MDSRRVNLVHFGAPKALVLGCGLGATRRRRTVTLSEVGCAACRASSEFREAERSAEMLRRHRERCGASGHVRRQDTASECGRCGAPLEVHDG